MLYTRVHLRLVYRVDWAEAGSAGDAKKQEFGSSQVGLVLACTA